MHRCHCLASLISIMEDFHHCTHFSMAAFTRTGEEIYRLGSSNLSENPFCLLEPSWEFFSHSLAQLTNNQKIINIIYHQLHYTLYPIDYDDQKIVLIIGPYTEKKQWAEFIVYKPTHCIPYMIDLLDSLLNQQKEKICPRSDQCLQGNLHIHKATQYIHQHYSEDLTLEDVIDQVKLNKSYFCQLFKQCTGKTFSQYLVDYRIEQSKSLLHYSDQSIMEIALASGFNTTNYFNACFKRTVGVTPTQFRNSHFQLS